VNPVPLALGHMLDAAAELAGLGLGPGDHAVLWMPNSIEQAAARCGGRDL